MDLTNTIALGSKICSELTTACEIRARTIFYKTFAQEPAPTLVTWKKAVTLSSWMPTAARICASTWNGAPSVTTAFWKTLEMNLTPRSTNNHWIKENNCKQSRVFIAICHSLSLNLFQIREDDKWHVHGRNNAPGPVQADGGGSYIWWEGIRSFVHAAQVRELVRVADRTVRTC